MVNISFATHTFASNNIQKCNCLFPDNAAACKAEIGKLENLSYLTKIEQMTGFWRVIHRPELWFLVNASLATWWQNNVVTPGLLKTQEGLLSLRTWPAQWCCTYSAVQNMSYNLTTLMLLNMRLTIM